MSDDERDIELLARAQAGAEAFGLIFRRHVNAVYNHCFRRLGSWSVAEDATSLVFLEAWRRRQRAVDVNGSLVPWLLGVANNVVRNLKRAAHRYDAALFRLPPPESEPDHADRVASRLDDEQRVGEILRRLSSLSRTEQDVVSLVVMAGLSYAEAAAALGEPELNLDGCVELRPCPPPDRPVQPVPSLVACTLDSGVAAVFPGDAGTCAELGLPELIE